MPGFIEKEYPRDPAITSREIITEVKPFIPEVHEAADKIKAAFDAQTQAENLTSEQRTERLRVLADAVWDQVTAGTIKMLLEERAGTSTANSPGRQAVYRGAEELERHAVARTAAALGIQMPASKVESEVFETKGLESARPVVHNLAPAIPDAVKEAVFSLRDINQVGTANLKEPFNRQITKKFYREFED